MQKKITIKPEQKKELETLTRYYNQAVYAPDDIKISEAWIIRLALKELFARTKNSDAFKCWYNKQAGWK